MSYIGERIKQLRVAQKMTQEALSKKLGVSASTVGMYERGQRSPDNDMLIKMSRVFSVSVDVLLGIKEISNEATDIITEMRERILSCDEILLNGVPMSMEDREKLLDAIEVATQVMLSKKQKEKQF